MIANREADQRASKLEESRQRISRRRQRRRALLVTMSCILAVCVFILVGLIAYRIYVSHLLTDEIVVEAGDELPDARDFLTDHQRNSQNAVYVTDTDSIDLHHVGTYEIVIDVNGNVCSSRLRLEDTVPPEGVIQEDRQVPLNGTLTAEDLMTDIADETEVSCSFKEEPDLSLEGQQAVTVVLTDEGGNQTDLQTNVLVFYDTTAPVIDGVAPLESYIGDTISYKGAITVTDDFDANVELEVDTDAVNPDQAGTYDVIYTATDSSGNSASQSTIITISEKPDNYVDPEEVYALADEVLEDITTEDMTLKEKAYEIFLWVQDNVSYINSSEKDSWTNAAYTGFTKHRGDCYVFFSTSKALLTEAGIPNIDVVKSDTSHSEHYWNLVNVGDGWYHFDTLPRYDGRTFFLVTDEELMAYSEQHQNSHIFDTSLYPATPTTASTIE